MKKGKITISALLNAHNNFIFPCEFYHYCDCSMIESVREVNKPIGICSMVYREGKNPNGVNRHERFN